MGVAKQEYMTSDFAPEVAKYSKVSISGVRPYCFTPVMTQLVNLKQINCQQQGLLQSNMSTLYTDRVHGRITEIEWNNSTKK